MKSTFDFRVTFLKITTQDTAFFLMKITQNASDALLSDPTTLNYLNITSLYRTIYYTHHFFLLICI
jgi:hypothetical protein